MGGSRCKHWLAALALAALVLPGWAAARQTLPPRRSQPPLVRVRDWAGANGFQAHWVEPEKILQLAKGDTKLVLNANSREARLNGVQVWLLKPFEYREGAGYLSQLDLDATIHPLLQPPRSSAKIRRICLDPGHGGKDPGNCVGKQEEQRYTLALAYELKDQLTRAGFKVTLTRTGDSFVDLPARPALARKAGADLLLSLHFNGTEGDRNEARGSEVYCLTPAGASSTAANSDGPSAGSAPGNRNNAKNLLLAHQMQKALLRGLGVEDRGVRRARFAVLRDATMPAVLIEAGFLSHPVEGKKILDTAYRREIAKSIVDGVRAYQRVVESKD
jgi:N-acetylmuramoyl-L-alanine amidase